MLGQSGVRQRPASISVAQSPSGTAPPCESKRRSAAHQLDSGGVRQVSAEAPVRSGGSDVRFWRCGAGGTGSDAAGGYGGSAAGGSGRTGAVGAGGNRGNGPSRPWAKNPWRRIEARTGRGRSCSSCTCARSPVFSLTARTSNAHRIPTAVPWPESERRTPCTRNGRNKSFPRSSFFAAQSSQPLRIGGRALRG